MSVDDIKIRTRQLIIEHPTATLATLDDEGFPHLRPMHTAGLDDNFTVYFATGRNMLKCRQIESNPRVSASWHAYLEEQSCWSHVLIKGNAEVKYEEEIRKRFWTEELEQYFPAGPDDPSYVIIVLRPKHVLFLDDKTYPPHCIVF